jgi:hypothetical protein
VSSYFASGGRKMRLIKFLLIVSALSVALAASAQEHGRIKRKPPSAIEAERIASEMAMNDGLLRKGDIVATDRGFFIFQGLAADGVSNDFAPISNPVPLGKK